MGNEVNDRKMTAAPWSMPRESWQQFRQYASEVKTETKRVTWPGMQEVYGTTVMVILTTFLFGIYFWICDQVFQIRRHALAEIFHAPWLRQNSFEAGEGLTEQELTYWKDEHGKELVHPPHLLRV